MKAQLFSLDALLALVFVTVAVMLLTTQFEHYYKTVNEKKFEENNLLASDLSQVAVKRVLAVAGEYTSVKPNVIKPDKMNDLNISLNSTLPIDYSYEASLSGDSISSTINRGSCSGKNFVSISNRSVIIYNDNSLAWFVMKVCS